MKSKAARIILAVSASVIGAVVIAVAVALVALRIRTDAILDDFSSIYSDEKYSEPVSVAGVNVIRQDVSCGYAVLEMFAAWSSRDLTEESLYREYGRVVTSTGQSFADEMNRQFPEYSTRIRKYLKNTELLELVYDQLSAGVPVPFEWAALYGSEWALHYSLITGMDVPNDKITVANPYGYTEEIPIDVFLQRTSFEAYERMPLLYRLGFAFGTFEKNTVFEVRALNGYVEDTGVGGKRYVWEKEGAGGDFTISLKNDGTFSYYAGPLSSYFALGSWTIDDGILTLTETSGYDKVFRFSVRKDELAFIAEGSSKFLYVTVEDGDRFIRDDTKDPNESIFG